MAGEADRAGVEALRALLARRGLQFPEADVAAGAAQIEAIRAALGELEQLGVADLEPTACVRFDEP